MPIFSYQCKKCGNDFELLEGITAEKVKRECPGCGSGNIVRKRSVFSVGSSGAGNDPACPTCPSPSGACDTGVCPLG